MEMPGNLLGQSHVLIQNRVQILKETSVHTLSVTDEWVTHLGLI